MNTTISRRVLLGVASASAAAFVFGATVAAAQGVIKIGTPLALTGGLADEGKKQKIAYDMWLKRINAAGGIKVGNKRMKVQLVEYDYHLPIRLSPTPTICSVSPWTAGKGRRRRIEEAIRLILDCSENRTGV